MVGLPRTESDLKHPENHYFRYRYAIYRKGKFYRFEKASDAPSTKDIPDGDNSDIAMDVGMDTSSEPTDDSSVAHHQLTLRLLANRESYVVNDVLGKITGPPDIDHNRMESNRTMDDTKSSIASMHSRNSSFGQSSSFSGLQSKGSGSQLNSINTPATSARKNAVGFAPAPPPYHRPKAAAALQAVHLNSTDGLVVVSAFLPVILHRNDQGKWSADWDYEALLSMQTHLRVIRIGVVKWRGWHGNFGMSGKKHASPEAAGVPVNERHLVEECLRPFNCVPVWMETSLFGEM
jgi:trehalose 6-phosphate synthase/phosphatase